MPLFKVPVKWSRWGIHEIEAETKEIAAHYAEFLPLPYMDAFIDNSACVLMDKIEEVQVVNVPIVQPKVKANQQGVLVPTELPVLLTSKDYKRKQAKEQVKAAIDVIRAFGAQSGMSDRSLFEFISLSKFMESELKDK